MEPGGVFVLLPKGEQPKMQKKTKKKKMVLNRETIKSLNDDVLDAVAGGCGNSDTCFTMCLCPCRDIHV